MSNTVTSNKTSSSNNISITFAKWFINKQRSTGILVDGKDFDFIISQLDNNAWDEFIAANSHANVDALITQLVQKMPKKPKKNADDAKPKPKPRGKKTTSDATEEDPSDNITEVIPTTEGAVKEVKKEVKKRAPKANKHEEVVVSVTEGADIVPEVLATKEPKDKKVPKKRAPKANKHEEVVVPVTEGADIVPEVLATNEVAVLATKEPNDKKEKKEVKKRAPKANKNEEAVEGPTEPSVVEVATTNEVAVVIAGKDKKEKKEVKKRTPKANKNYATTEDTEIATTDVPEIQVPATTDGAVAAKEKKEPKKRGQKKGKSVEENRAPDEVILPLQEQSILSEEPYQEQEDETILTEIFVNEVLFYVDSDGNWFDYNLQQTTKQN